MSLLHVISVSGGKDLTALLLRAIERIKDKSRIIPIFCDTGNEHEEVYRYLNYLESALDLSITRLKANFDEQIAAKRRFIENDQRQGERNEKPLQWQPDAKKRALENLHPTGNPFLDLCMWKGRFPSRKAQFCTEELKRNPAVSFQLDLVDKGHKVVSWQGFRRDESMNRRKARMFESIGPNMWAYRPLVEWSAQRVFDYHAQHNIEPNPLYKQGMTRVGCMPCINVRKSELAEIAARFPEHIERIAEWENKVGQCAKRGQSTFFAGDLTGLKTVNDMVDWSITSRGGREYDLFQSNIDKTMCASAYGLCE